MKDVMVEIFFYPSQYLFAPVPGGDDLWDSGAAVVAVDGDLAGFRGEDFRQEERGAAVAAVRAVGIMVGGDGKALEDGGEADRRGDPLDPGYLRLEQEVREAHGIHGEGERREREGYRLEDVRLRTYVRPQNMMALVTAVAYFTSIYLGVRLNLRVLARHVLRAARRVLGIPDFRLYALADGIKHFLFSQSKGLKLALPPPKPRYVQRFLFDV
jgi:hypothetical protein